MRVLLPILLALVVSGVVLLALGKNPLAYYGEVLNRGLFNWGGLQATITRMAPLLLIAAGLVVSFQAGIWNLGTDGQFLLAAVAAAALSPVLVGIVPWGVAITLIAHRRFRRRRGMVADPGFPQGELRHQRDHHLADDELSRNQSRQRAGQDSLPRP